MTARSLDEAITELLVREGATYTADPQDTPTRYGITLGSYQAWRPAGTEAELRVLPEPEARAFYHWYLAPFSEVATTPKAWANLLDAATLHGRLGATRLAQRALGLRADGVLGPDTQRALVSLGASLPAEQRFLVAFAQARLRLMRDDLVRDLTARYGPEALALSDLKYLGGWQRRVVEVAFG